MVPWNGCKTVTILGFCSLCQFESDSERDGGSQLECLTSSGQYLLDLFNFGDINLYQNIAARI